MFATARKLREAGVLFAGIDVIGDFLTEVNVTSPTGIRELDKQFDLILLTPPSHRGHAVDDRVARGLFRQAARRLAPGGELRVVANQHLGYQRPLGKLFPRVDTVARNAKFVIFRCLKGSP